MDKEYGWLLWFLPLFFLGATICLIYFLFFASKDIPKGKEYKCYSRVFLILWCVFIIAFVLGNKFQIYLLKDIPFDVYFFGITILIVVNDAVYVSKFRRYLEKNYHEIWKEIYDPKDVRFNSSFRVFKLVYLKDSLDSLNDPVITKLKRAMIHMSILSGAYFITFPIVFIGCFKNLKVLFM